VRGEVIEDHGQIMLHFLLVCGDSSRPGWAQGCVSTGRGWRRPAGGGCVGAIKNCITTVGRGDDTIFSCGSSIAPLLGRRARIVAARLDIYSPSPCPRREWTDGAFPVLDPRGFYSTSGACSVSPFTTLVSGEGSARRQPEVASSAYSSSPRRNGHNLHRSGKSRFGFMSILGTQPNHTMLDPNSAMSAPSQGSICGAIGDILS